MLKNACRCWNMRVKRIFFFKKNSKTLIYARQKKSFHFFYAEKRMSKKKIQQNFKNSEIRASNNFFTKKIQKRWNTRGNFFFILFNAEIRASKKKLFLISKTLKYASQKSIFFSFFCAEICASNIFVVNFFKNA
jgi:hypothetical protein